MGDRRGVCLFCLRGDGGFKTKEHLWPEALGNKRAVLPPGVVCDTCNRARLSVLDKALVEFPPIALSLVLDGITNKRGRIVPREFDSVGLFPISADDGSHGVLFRNAQVTEPPPDGKTLPLKLTHTLGDLEWGRVARCVLAIGLESVALREGPTVALERRFDGVRRAVLEGYAGYLVQQYADEPRDELRAGYRSQDQPALTAAQFGAWVDIRGLFLVATWPAPPGVFPGDVAPEVTEAKAFARWFARASDRKQGRTPCTWEHVITSDSVADAREVQRHISDIERSLGARGRKRLILDGE